MKKVDIIKKFYDAFSNADYETMNKCYHDEIIFNDEIFHNLDFEHVTNMWKLLISNKENNKMNVTYELKEDDGNVYVIWTANYLFGPKKRKVKNIVRSIMEIKDDKIIKHTDSFNFKKWAKQSIGGLAGMLANKKFIKNKISNAAMENLNKSIGK